MPQRLDATGDFHCRAGIFTTAQRTNFGSLIWKLSIQGNELMQIFQLLAIDTPVFSSNHVSNSHRLEDIGDFLIRDLDMTTDGHSSPSYKVW